MATRLTDPEAFTTFSEMLRYLRRRVRLTQRDLGIAVGYSEGHINRFEKSKHLPDPAAVTALFIPALQLEDEPQLAARLVELTQAPRPKSPAETPLAPASLPLFEGIPPSPGYAVARPQALERLRRRWGVERRILLSGMAGAGKTTLAAAFAREMCAAGPVFWLTFTPGVTAAVETFIHRLALFLAEQGHAQLKLLQAVPGSPPLSLDRSLALLTAALNRQPVLLCLDNAEVIADDEPLLLALRHICATTPAGMLLTSRETLPLAGIPEMTLTGLDPEEGIALVRTLSENRLTLPQAARLYEKTGGNPMLIRLATAHVLECREDVLQFIECLDTQPQVAGYLLETVQKQLSPAEWQWLSLLAVLYKPVDLYDERLNELVQPLGPSQETSTIILNLQRHHLIDDARHAQLNPLVRDYVYHALKADVRRRRLHRLAGDWYAGMSAASLSAAAHYAEAGLLEETVEVIAQGEKEIIARGEVSAAVAVLDQILAQHTKHRAPADDVLRRLLTIRGALLSATSRAAEAEANLRQALALATNPAVRADLVYRMRMVLGQRGQYSDALQLIQAAQADLTPADQLLRAQLYVAESRIHELTGNHAEALRCAELAIGLANQIAHISRLPAEEIRADAYYALASVARRNRHVDTSIEYAHCALRSANRSGQHFCEVSCLAFIGGMLYDSGDLDGALRYRREALARAESVEDQVGVGYCLTHLAEVDTLLLRPAEALQKLDQAISILGAAGGLRGLASALSLSAQDFMLQGNLAQAEATIQRVIAEMEGPATRRGWSGYLNRLAMIQMTAGKVFAARTTVERAIALPQVAEDPILQFELDTSLALAQALDGDLAAACRTLGGSPRMDGLSMWVELDRDLIESCVAYLSGDLEKASRLAAQLAQQCHAYPLYQRRAERLCAAARSNHPISEIPRLLWLGLDP